MDWLSEHAWAAWLGVAALLGVAEMFSLDLVLLMLAVGAIGGGAAAALDAPVVVQVLVAAATALGTLTLVRPPLVKKLHSGPELSMSHGRLVGTQGLVLQTISGLQPGRVKLAGDEWSAAPYDETLVIEPGATAYVHPVPQLDR